MHTICLNGVFLLVIAGCTTAECPDGYVAGEGGLCLQDAASNGDTGPNADDNGGTPNDSALDTDDVDSGTDSATDTGTDSATDTGADTGTVPQCSVASDGSATYTEIQAAVDDATDGDTIYVCSGTYDYVEIARINLSIVGVDGSDTTVIDGGSHPAIAADGVTISISGFTLTGTGQNAEPYSSALYAVDAQVVVSDIAIRDCAVGSNGGYVVALRNSASTWQRVTVEDNDAGEWGSLFSAFANEGSTVDFQMQHAVIRDNAGMLAFYFARIDLEFQNNLIYGNALDGYDMPFTFSSDQNDPGVQTIWNNTFYNNTNDGGRAAPSLTGSHLDFQNNIVATSVYHASSQTSSAATSYNAFFEVGMIDGAGTGNIVGNPYFADAGNGDFTLDPGFSPCIDAGNPLSGYNDADNSRNDMGAFGGPGGLWP